MGSASSYSGDGRPAAWLWLLVALAAIGLSHSSALSGGFVWDDHHLIEGRASVQELEGLPSYFAHPYWTQPEFGGATPPFYRPLVTLSLALDHAWWRGDPAGFHLTNLLFHLTVCALVFALCLRGGTDPWSAALATLLFGTLPRLTESVSWISGRTDLLAAVGALSCIAIYTSNAAGTARRLAAALALAAGLFAKEVAIAALGALALLELARVLHRRTTASGALRNLVPLAAATALYLGLRTVAFSAGGTGDLNAEPSTVFGLWERFAVFPLETLGSFARMLGDPLQPVARIGRMGIVDGRLVALGVGVGVAALALLVRALRRPWPPLAIAALGLVGAALLPVLNLGRPLQSVVASDRFLYLPAAGIALLLAVQSQKLPRTAWRSAAAAAAVLAVTFGVATHRRAEQWRSDLLLWQADAPRAHPLDPVPHALLANAYGRERQPELALRTHRRAMEIEERFALRYPGYPRDILLQVNFGLALTEVESFDAAVRHLAGVVAHHPETPVAHLALGTAYGRALELDRARGALESALRHQPEYPKARRALAQLEEASSLIRELPPASNDSTTSELARRAKAYALLGRTHEAAALFDRVVTRPNAPTPELHRAALFLVMRGETDQARRALARLASRDDSPAGATQLLRHQLASRPAR